MAFIVFFRASVASVHIFAAALAFAAAAVWPVSPILAAALLLI